MADTRTRAYTVVGSRVLLNIKGLVGIAGLTDQIVMGEAYSDGPITFRVERGPDSTWMSRTGGP